jgi:hypothetical protein
MQREPVSSLRLPLRLCVKNILGGSYEIRVLG